MMSVLESKGYSAYMKARLTIDIFASDNGKMAVTCPIASQATYTRAHACADTYKCTHKHREKIMLFIKLNPTNTGRIRTHNLEIYSAVI